MKTIAKSNFHDRSQLAARTERVGEYEDAANLWKEAALLAESIQNIEWAMRRKLFCMKRMRQSS
ncbi:ANR family transcriptional regulator [Escherichia coli]|uniref:ANR family transcriptional regulator n=1 Tax=Citrobacter portucalensis TaxID=1639133 RepID=UPI0015812F0F|nr:ANR family transcriptional regulator [Escherichia coli]EFE8234452.1 ANR family transcriptional regulator [Escherichia coli]NUH52192.1 ANR family transcriptional regulator [Citrobacter portucalensis]